MRRLLMVLSLVGSFAAMSCGGGKEIKFADFHYQVSCHETRGCVTNVYNINDSDGNGDVRVNQCLISRTGSSPALAFNVSNTDASGQPFSMQLASGFFDEATGNVTGAACTLTVTEGGTTYRGRCGSGAPTTMVPCQITGIRQTYTPTDVDNPDPYPQVEGTILCQHLQNAADATVIREVEADSVTPGHAFPFRIVFCDGAMPPAM